MHPFVRMIRFMRLLRRASQMRDLLVQIEDQFSTRVFLDYGKVSRHWHLMAEAQRLIRAAGGNVIGDDRNDA